MKSKEYISKYQGMKNSELEAELLKLENQASKSSMAIYAGKETDFSSIGKIKKNIARINTILSQKESL